VLGYLEYINQYTNIPVGLVIAIVVFFAISNLIGEILELSGKVVPEFVKFRKYFARKKQERETLARMPEMMSDVQKLLSDVDQHYSTDNIAMRNKWIDAVNTRLDDHEEIVREINRKLDKNSEDITDLRVDNKRETIISFAEKVADYKFPATREQFNRIFKIHEEYERIIKERGLTNGEIDVAYKIIEEAYQHRLINHSFIEDVRWHGFEQ